MKKKIAFITALILVTIQFTAISVIPSSADDIVSWRTYYFRNAYSGKYLDLTSNGTINGTELQQYDFGYPSELFNVRVQSDGYYVIETMLVNDDIMVLDGRSNCVAGAQVILYEQVLGASEQLWEIRKNNNDTYCLSPKKNTSLNLSVENASSSNGAKVKLATKNDRDPCQQWYIEAVSEAAGVKSGQEYYIRNMNSGKYLDLTGNGVVNSTLFQQYPFKDVVDAFRDGGYPSGRFRITEDATGYFLVETTMPNATGTKVMDGRSNCVAGAQVILYDFVGADEQYWHFRKNEDGTYYITPSKNIYLNLAVTGNSTENNAVVSLAGSTYNQESQIWCLEPVEMSTYDFSYMFANADNDSYIYSGYKLADRSDHYAVDIVHKNSPDIAGRGIYAPVSGNVKYVYDYHKDSGNYLVLETDQYWTGTGNRIRLTFAHMLYPANYDVGDRIDKGDLIGYVGTTGYSTGEHLHFATYRNTSDADYWERSGNSVNPQRFFPGVPFTGKTSTVIP